MANKTIYPKGSADVTVPATESIAISNYGGGIAQIYYLIESANAPDAFQLQQTLENGAVVLGPFTAETVVRIEANNSKVIYDVGASPDTGIGDADTLNGLAADTADTADTIAARDSSGDITANAFESTVATGTPPMVVSSTTVVTNFNADTVDGIQGSNLAKLDAANIFTKNQTLRNSAVGGTGISTSGDNLLIEEGSSANVGITLKSGSGRNKTIFFADETTSAVGIIQYDGTNNQLRIGVDSLSDNYYLTSDSRILIGTDEVYHTGNDSTLAKINATSGALQLPTLASDPASGAENGQMYYNTTSHVIRAYINGSWVDNT